MTSDTGASYSLPAGHSFSAFIISPYLGAKPKIKKTVGVVSGSTLTVSLGTADTDNLVAGKYVGQIAFAIAGGGYVYSDPFVVIVTAQPDIVSAAPA